MDKQFEVNLDVVPERKISPSNLSQAARALWGFPEEEEVSVEETAESKPVQDNEGRVYNMMVDSPKELWDVVGHINVSFYAPDWKGVLERVNGCVMVWDKIRETYADRIAAEKEKELRASPSQLSFVRQLSAELGEPAPTVTEGMTKEEVGALIDELVARRNAHRQPVAQPSPVAAPASAPSGSSFRSSKGKPMSEKQASLINDLCSRFKLNLPDGFQSFTSAQASAFIQEHIGR